ncbi:MAG TPA: M23 family metallopeptidase, partial [Chloroflexota bacterium]|nr:M23 family metallopeptidase [Chloroflexota bacterium]
PDGSPVEQVSLSTGKVNYLLTDANGSVRAVLDGSSGAIDATTTYDSFGNPTTTPLSQGGVNYPGLTQYTPMGAGAAYTDPSGLQTADGSTLTDNGTGQGLTSLAATGSKSGHMRVFWDKKAVGTGSKTKGCKTKGRGWIYTPTATPNGPLPCGGNWYGQSDHTGWNHFAIDWEAQSGDTVHSQYSGTVSFSGWWDCSAHNCGHKWGFGQAVVVEYNNGVTAWYGHMSHLRFHIGGGSHHRSAHVGAGETLGKSGKTGETYGTNGASEGPYADHVHLGFGSPVKLCDADKGDNDYACTGAKGKYNFTGAVESGTSVKQGVAGGPLISGCKKAKPLGNLRPHTQYRSCFS